MRNVLVTGMSGLIGTALRKQISDRYVLSALNRSAVDGVPTTRASLGDMDAITPAFTGIDTVVHLAAKISDDYGWDALHETNVVGMRNILEAATNAAVRRVVFVSSGATVAGWEREEPYNSLVNGRYSDLPKSGVPLITEQMATRPANLYASTKVWGEALCRHYSDNHGLETLCLRIGYANEEDRPTDHRQRSVWNSQRDVVNAIELAMNAVMKQRFEVCFVLSNNKYRYRSLDYAEQLLGFEPMDSADSFFS